MGVFDFFKRPSSKVAPTQKETPQVAKVMPETAKKITPIKFPTKKNGHPIQYAYAFDITPAPGIDIINDIIDDSEKFLIPEPMGDEISLTYNGVIVGSIKNPEKAVMLNDWIKKGFPYDAILRADGKTVNLRFYRDKRIGNEYREQTVVAITGYKSGSKQDSISFLEPGDEVDLGENYEREDTVDVLIDGIDKIGALPKKIATRVIEEGAYAAFYEKGEAQETDDGTIIKPYIRIYW